MTEKYLAAGVAVENTAYHFDKLYDYAVPDDMRENARPGCRVMISFGHGALRQGMIMELHEIDDISGLKTISELIDREPVLTPELVGVALSMSERCFCTLFEACKAMLPAGLSVRITYSYRLAGRSLSEREERSLSDTERQIIAAVSAAKSPIRQDRLIKSLGLDGDSLLAGLYKRGILERTELAQKRLQDKTLRMITLINEEGLKKPSPLQKSVIDVLRSVGDVSKKELCYYTGASPAVADNLVKKGICAYYDAEPPQTEQIVSQTVPEEEITLTEEQESVYKGLLEEYGSGKPSAALLYGITGSGKTSVFMKLIDRANEDNKGVICMVPEIALTPQLLAKFTARYGDRVAVFHSGLSISKRLEEWKRVKNGQANIAVGTRSAVFAPLENTGLIVMDEEQEYSYKSSASPRFHARDIAKLRCVHNNCMLLLSSATPSLESYFLARSGRYSLYTLTKRYGTAKLPKVTTADMNRELQSGGSSYLSSELLEAIEKNLDDGRQSIILLNRRGHNTFVACRSCRSVISCPNCSISLTYHSANNRLMCHYCGYSVPVPKECPECRSEKLRFSGAGTQKAEAELAELFPQAKILRLDTDSTMQRYSYEKKLSAFQRGEYDIMLGTQMVAKGLDFENVTLVGVLSADALMHNDDFRSYERTFSLLTQVVGRSGRGEQEGRAIIQTFEPENPVIEMAAEQDYIKFYESEIDLRKIMLYPPFSDLCVVGFISEDRDKANAAAHYFEKSLAALAKEKYPGLPLRVIGPTPAVVARVSGRYRFRLIIKFKNSPRFRKMLSSLLAETGKNREFTDVTVFADIDPDTII